MTNAFENFTFVKLPSGVPDEDPDTSVQYAHARQEGWYALSRVEPDIIPAAITAESLAEDIRMSSPGVEYDEVDVGHISPFIDPWAAVYALRVALRVIDNKGGLQEERDEALRAIGFALRSVEDPD